jgi:hypothetical protein
MIRQRIVNVLITLLQLCKFHQGRGRLPYRFTDETSSSQLSHVLVGNDDHESPAELSFLTTRNSSRSGRTLRVHSLLIHVTTVKMKSHQFHFQTRYRHIHLYG